MERSRTGQSIAPRNRLGALAYDAGKAVCRVRRACAPASVRIAHGDGHTREKLEVRQDVWSLDLSITDTCGAVAQTGEVAKLAAGGASDRFTAGIRSRGRRNVEAEWRLRSVVEEAVAERLAVIGRAGGRAGEERIVLDVVDPVAAD